MNKELKEFLATFHANVLSLANLISTPAPTDEPLKETSSLANLAIAAAMVSDRTTKFTLAFSGPDVKPDDAKPFGEMLQQAILALFSHYIVVSSSPLCGKTLKHFLEQSTTRILLDVADLISAFLNTQDGKVSPHLTAKVWEACKIIDAEDKITNKTAICSQIQNWNALIKDAVKEFEDQLAKSATLDNINNKSNNKDDDLDDDDFDDFDDLDVDLSKEITILLPNVITLLKCAWTLFKKVTDIVSALPHSQDDIKQIHILDSITDTCKAVAATIDQIGCSIYDDEPKSVIEKAKVIGESCIGVMDQLSSLQLDDKERESLEKLFKLMKAKLADTIGALSK